MSHLTLTKFGINIKVPCLLLEYKADKKLKQLVMPIRDFNGESNVESVARDLKRKEAILQIPVELIEKMLKILQGTLKGLSLNEAIDKVNVNDNGNLQINDGCDSPAEGDTSENSKDFW
ncbi:uncharacterized protein LOC107264295 [Cephus cinctus]|uniref:Uncharacterized protein LOC107264295 n=1 Tax=Cephus cinctus TaxID=211228 RepID=A0AAJ7BK25_CEPCN|nr:uncharacterized protein LOC107264295 [Cephus cinctus]